MIANSASMTIDEFSQSFYAAVTTLLDPIGDYAIRWSPPGIFLGPIAITVHESGAGGIVEWSGIGGTDGSAPSVKSGSYDFESMDDPVQVAAEVDTEIRKGNWPPPKP